MPDLRDDLRALAADVDWPATPDLATAVLMRLLAGSDASAHPAARPRPGARRAGPPPPRRARPHAPPPGTRPPRAPRPRPGAPPPRAGGPHEGVTPLEGGAYRGFAPAGAAAPGARGGRC